MSKSENENFNGLLNLAEYTLEESNTCKRFEI